MRTVIKNLLVIIILLWILDILFGLFCDYMLVKTSDGRYYKARYSLEICKEDIVILGSSRAETNYAPWVLEDSLKMSCWNAGRGGQSLPFWICMTEGMLHRYCPKKVIINVEDDLLCNNLQESYERAGFLRPFYKGHPEIRPILDNISKREILSIFSKFYAYNSSFYYLLRPLLFKGLDGLPSEKGWKPRLGKMTSAKTPPMLLDSIIPLNQECVQLFNQLVDSYVRKGCSVYVVISPNFNQRTIKTASIEYFKKMKNIHFYDFSNQEVFWSNGNYFVDNQHLNKEGALMFTAMLAQKILNQP